MKKTTKKTSPKRKIEMLFDNRSQEWRNDPPFRAPTEHSIGLIPQLYQYDLQAIFRDAVQRVQQLYTGRLLGIVEPECNREANQKLLAGELEFMVAPGKVAVLLAQPQMRFKPSKIVIDDESSDWYDVSNVKVGKNSQLISPNPISGAVFRADNLKTFGMDTAEISMFLTVELVNVSGKPRRFPRVTMVGQIVEAKTR